MAWVKGTHSGWVDRLAKVKFAQFRASISLTSLFFLGLGLPCRPFRSLVLYFNFEVSSAVLAAYSELGHLDGQLLHSLAGSVTAAILLKGHTAAVGLCGGPGSRLVLLPSLIGRAVYAG